MFFSCKINDWENTVIKNNSDFPVTFKFSNTSVRNLEPGQSTSFRPSAYQHIESYSPQKRVEFKYISTNDGSTGEFINHQSYDVKVINELGETATLSADDWMDVIENIPAGDQSSNPEYQRRIYTENPDFTVTTESTNPAVAIFKREPDKNFLVTLQWK